VTFIRALQRLPTLNAFQERGQVVYAGVERWMDMGVLGALDVEVVTGFSVSNSSLKGTETNLFRTWI